MLIFFEFFYYFFEFIFFFLEEVNFCVILKCWM